MAAEIEILVDAKNLAEFKADQEAVEKALGYANRFANSEVCQTLEEANEIADAVSGIARARRDANQHRLDATASYRATSDAINHEWGEMLSPALAAEEALKNKGIAFQKAEEARAAEAARKAQADIDRRAEEAAQAAQEAAELAAEEPADEEMQALADETRSDAAAAAVAPPPVVHAPPRQLRGGGGGRLGSRKVMRFEIEDREAVPEKYKVISADAIKADIKAEVAAVKANPGSQFKLEIPGVRIFPVDVPISR